MIFSTEGRHIPILLQYVQQILRIQGILEVMIGSHLMAFAVPPRHHADSCRHTGGIGRISIFKIHAALRPLIQKWHRVQLVSTALTQISPLLVRHDNNNILLFFHSKPTLSRRRS